MHLSLVCHWLIRMNRMSPRLVHLKVTIVMPIRSLQMNFHQSLAIVAIKAEKNTKLAECGQSHRHLDSFLRITIVAEEPSLS